MVEQRRHPGRLQHRIGVGRLYPVINPHPGIVPAEIHIKMTVQHNLVGGIPGFIPAPGHLPGFHLDFSHGGQRPVQVLHHPGFPVLNQGHFCHIVQKIAIVSPVLDARQGHSLRVRQESHCHCAADNQGKENNPESRLFVRHDLFDPLLDPYLSESQRAGSNGFAPDTAMEQRPGIGLPLLPGQVPDDLLITGGFNVPAQQDVGQPQHRIEPVHAQKQETQRLPPVVPAADMGLLMSNHIVPVFRLHVRRQVDHRTQQPQHEGRIHPFAAFDPRLHEKRRGHPPPQHKVAEQGIQQHPRHTSSPEPGQHKRPDLGGIGAGSRSGSQGLLQRRIHRLVHCLHPALNPGCGRIDNFLGQWLGAGNQAQGALQGNRAHQPQGNQPPQQAKHPLGGLPEYQAYSHRRQHQVAGGDAHIHQLQK